MYLLYLNVLIGYALGACSDNPFLDQFLALLNNLEMDISQYNSYLTVTPSVQSLGICTQMNSQSCCTIEMEQFFNAVITKFEAKLLDNQSQLQQLLNQFELDIGICGLVNKTSFQNSLIGDSTISNYKSQLRVLASLQAGFLQGNLCILCSTPDNTKFIKNNKIVAQKANYDTYITSLVNQYESLQSLVINFRQYILQYYVAYTDTLNCSSTLESFLLSWQNVVVCPGNDCKNFIQQTIQPLGYRQLAAEDYYIFSDTDGILTYIAVESVSSSNSAIYTLVVLIVFLMQ